MGGHIWLESEGLGKGCTAIFFVKLGIPDNSSEGSSQIVSSVQSNFLRIDNSGVQVLGTDNSGLVVLQSPSMI